jgi:hypothetical protein
MAGWSPGLPGALRIQRGVGVQVCSISNTPGKPQSHDGRELCSHGGRFSPCASVHTSGLLTVHLPAVYNLSISLHWGKPGMVFGVEFTGCPIWPGSKP